MKTKFYEIWIAETIHNGLIWGHNYDELSNTTLYFYPGSVCKITISERTYNKLNETDADGCSYYVLEHKFGKYVACCY